MEQSKANSIGILRIKNKPSLQSVRYLLRYEPTVENLCYESSSEKLIVKCFYKNGSLREKCPNTEFFLVHIFSPNTGKYGPEKTKYLYTFHTVVPALMSHVDLKVYVKYIDTVSKWQE